MKEWNLDVLYTGYNKEFDQDWNKLATQCKQFAAFMQTDLLNDLKTAEQIITYLEDIESLTHKLNAFISLKQAVNTLDNESVNKGNAFEKLCSSLSKPYTQMQKYFANYQSIDSLFNTSSLAHEYEYFIRNIKDNAKYCLSDDVEEAIAKLNVNGGSGWENMREYLTSTLEVEYNNEMLPLMSVRNMAYDPDPKVRKSAYEAELKSYEKIKDATAFSLNCIKGQVITLAQMRGYESVLAMTLNQSHMDKATLDALMSAIKQNVGVFQKYLKRKGELLGHKHGLPWYDMFAPIGKTNTKYSVKDAQAYLTKHFSTFSSDLVDLVNHAFDDQWIDFFPRVGKVGGAFCWNLQLLNQSRVLTNFDGKIGDVITLAHELGHAYHGFHLESHRPLNMDYSMPVAETASTFNETLIMNAAINDASGDEKIALIENQLQDITQTIIDIYSRFLFESAVFEKRNNQFLFAPELEKMMLDAQKEAYQDGLDNSILHPFQWVNKSHYYSTNLSFYNFPYAFGSLFARGLFELYQENPTDFVPKYKEMLHATSINSVEDAAHIMGIDLRSEAFWNKALGNVTLQIEDFIRLSEELKK